MQKAICTGLIITGFLVSCASNKPLTIGSLEKLDEDFSKVISGSPAIEIIGEGYEWSEGPVWVEAEKMLLFSDVPRNIVYKWTEANGVVPYLSPSGYTGSAERGGETGSNGLAVGLDGKLYLAQHGDRRIARMESGLSAGIPRFTTIAGTYDGKKFNSPNDLFITSSGEIYFTDPPYGLEKQMNDPAKEIPFQGVYRVNNDGQVKLLVDSLTRPNGIIVTADGQHVIVANSDSDKAIWYRYSIQGDSLGNPGIFYDATEAAKNDSGLPDGLKSDKNGTIYASGPGGVWIFNKDGKVLGKIRVPAPVSNCALSDDEKTLFMTADNYLLRVKLK